MNKYELIAKTAKYATIISCVYIISKSGLNLYFDNNKPTIENVVNTTVE